MNAPFIKTLAGVQESTRVPLGGRTTRGYGGIAAWHRAIPPMSCTAMSAGKRAGISPLRHSSPFGGAKWMACLVIFCHK